MYKGPIRVTSGDICGISRNCVRDRIPVMTWVILLSKALGLGKIVLIALCQRISGQILLLP